MSRPPGDGVVAHLRDARPLVRLRVPFTVNRIDIDDVERGSQDSDWDPVKDAAKKLAFIEDRAIFEGYDAAHIGGIRKCSSNTALALPDDPSEIPDVISQALSELRLAGVDGPYSVLLSADIYTQVSESTAHGYPIREHINRLVDGDIIWAPAIDGAFVLSTRGGDFDLQLGTDVSIGYLSHDADAVQLYLEETMTFLCYTAEASVACPPSHSLRELARLHADTPHSMAFRACSRLARVTTVTRAMTVTEGSGHQNCVQRGVEDP